MNGTAVIIPAAGASRRFGGRRSKILEPVGGEPMFLRTCAAFARRRDVVQIVLAVSPEGLDGFRSAWGERLAILGVETVGGGASRGASVRNALAALREEAALVAVHDAARPCITQEAIDAVFAAAGESGAAILGVPVAATLKRVREGRIEATVDRESLWEAQTPQVFERELFRRACAADAEATDDAALVEALGHPVRIVRGDRRNLKVTTAEDLKLARAILSALGQ